MKVKKQKRKEELKNSKKVKIKKEDYPDLLTTRDVDNLSKSVFEEINTERDELKK